VTDPVAGAPLGRAVGGAVAAGGVAAPPDDDPEPTDPPDPETADGGAGVVGRTVAGEPDADAPVAPLGELESTGLVEGSVAAGCTQPAAEPTTRASAMAIRNRTRVLMRNDL
jgi:hypothetical protein